MRTSLAVALLTLVLMLAAVSAADAVCVGDCSSDGVVTVNELIVGVNIALARGAIDDCIALDSNGDDEVRVDELVSAVQSLLRGCPPARLITLSREGLIASLDITAPWAVRASQDLGKTIGSARCSGGRCLVTHPAQDSISVVDAPDLSADAPIELARGSDPRDVVFIDDRTVVVSQYGSAALLEIDLDTRATVSIDLSALADADGLPEALRMASCGRRVFVQLRRVEHDTDTPAAIGAALAVVDLDRPERERVVDVDPATEGVQGIALAGRPNFDMPVDCSGGVLYVAEPAPLMQGGGGYEQVDLTTLTASELPIDTGAEVGGFEVVEAGLYWLITHTEFGPGPSSHLNQVGGSTSDTHNTFALEHVNDLALDRDQELLFYPDPCFERPTPGLCDRGIYVYGARSGALLSGGGVDVGFAPIELVVSR